MSNTTILQWGPHEIDPNVFELILDHAVEHRPWFMDNVWNAGPAVRRAFATRHLLAAYSEGWTPATQWTPEEPAVGRVWEAWRGAELLGIFVLNNVRPGLDAQAHFLFFDRKLANKRQLCREMMRVVFADETLGLHALRVDLPEYASKLAWFLRNGLGFKFEAERRLKNPKQAEKASRRHHGAFYEGKWMDVLLLSLTRQEFDEWPEHKSRRS